VKGSVLLKAGTKAFGKVRSSRANPRKPCWMGTDSPLAIASKATAL
jgi:hypothetical protein